ncbi:MAG: ATP-binding protein [Deltaproteobacteria bacterium]|nr:ATP-binding protein [Deltaproteobacteria bacterium]
METENKSIKDFLNQFNGEAVEVAFYDISCKKFVLERGLAKETQIINILEQKITSDNKFQFLIETSGNNVYFVFKAASSVVILKTLKIALLEALMINTEISRLFTLGTLVTKISHEFNNILTGLSGHTSFLFELIENTDLKRSAELLKEGVERATLLTKELVSYSKPATRWEKIRISSFIERLNLWTKIIVPPSIKFSFHDLTGNVEFETDVVKLNQVFINLVKNSVEAMEGSGEIKIMSTLREGQICFEISDTGTGMTEDEIENVFKPFATTKETGTGLGCFISKSLVEEIGGTIKIISEKNRGTTVTVSLPISKIKSVSTHSIVFPVKCRVLLVDDDENVREVLRMGLQYHGFEVIPASNYDEAINEAKKSGFDVAVVDIIMPGKSGLETAIDLQKILPDLKFVVISGYSPPETIEVFKSIGIETFLNKPFSIDELVYEVNKLVKPEDMSLKNQKSRTS